MSKKKTTTIFIDEKAEIPVDPPVVNLSRSDKDNVIWKHKRGKPFVVVMKSLSPFRDNFFFPGKEDSGPARSNAAYGPYDYSVQVGQFTIDPRVIIDP